MAKMIYVRWENKTRWYEVRIMPDLFGTWNLVRSWGGQGRKEQGSKNEVYTKLIPALERLLAINEERSKRKPPYVPLIWQTDIAEILQRADSRSDRNTC